MGSGSVIIEHILPVCMMMWIWICGDWTILSFQPIASCCGQRYNNPVAFHSFISFVISFITHFFVVMAVRGIWQSNHPSREQF